MPQSNPQTQTTDSPRAPPAPAQYSCTDCCYIFGKSGMVCGVCIKKILTEQKGIKC